MAKANKAPDANRADHIEYRVGKYVFAVTPMYNESGKTIHEALLLLMKNEVEKHEKS